MDKIVIAVMAFFMLIGALDKALFDGRFGYGKEFEKGLNAMGPLAMVMVGIMCAAPAIGANVGPVLAPFFLSIGSDPAMIAGMFLGVDSGGLPIAQALATRPEAAILSGIGLGGTLGAVMTFALPISLSMADSVSRPYVAKGLVAGIIASPVSLIPVGLMTGCNISTIVSLGAPAFVMAFVLAFFLSVFRDPTIRFFLILARLLMGAFVLLLAVAALQHYFPITLIARMDKIETQLAVIGEIGIMLAGAFPLIFFVKKYLMKGIHAIASMVRTDDTAALGMIVSIANPLPMYAMVNKMSNRGKVLCSAFSGPILTLLGDHLGYVTAAYPQGIEPLLVGKVTAAVLALIIALALEHFSPTPEN